ncbi:MAG: chorismate synthase [Clostridiaceae bacterium BRH_c20a]|nr:MAG: chorismate synthase [Clostridiaceae bacterium BRH_c20a]
MLRFLTAGESHGQALTAIIEGFPAGVPIAQGFINNELRKRQGGYGRGKRMEIEQDQVEILSGVRNGQTLGSPITLQVKNKDWQNWQDIMGVEEGANIGELRVTKPRPGHADLAGTLKYGYTDIRNTLERASARETAVRVAVGAVAQAFLNVFKINILGHVIRIGDVEAQADYNRLTEELYETQLYCTDEKVLGKMIEAIDEAKIKGDSLGGIIEVAAFNVPLGLGSHVHWDRRLDGRLAQALMSIPAIKGVEIGLGFNSAKIPGSQVHDEIAYNSARSFYHLSNNSGGIEGGISNGETIILRAAMKPIPTLYQPLKSVDIFSKENYLASIERSDNCAVPAAAIVAVGMTAFEIARSFLEKFSGDNLREIKNSYDNYYNYLRQV